MILRLSVSTRTTLRTHLRTPLFRNGYALIISAITMSGLGMLFWVMAARWYSPESVGLNSSAISAMMFVAGIAHFGLGDALVRFLPKAGSATRRLVAGIYIATIVIAAVVSSLFVIVIGFWFPTFGQLHVGLAIGVCFVLATITWCMFGLEDDALTGLRRAPWIPIENGAVSLAKLGLLILLAGQLPRYGIYLAWIVPVSLALFPVNVLVFRHLIPQHVSATRDQSAPPSPSRVMRYSAGNHLGTLFAVSSTSLLPLIVLHQSGSSATAYFYLAWIIAYALQLVSQNMALSLTVEGANDELSLNLQTRRAVVHLARMLVPGCVVVVVGAPYILRMFGRTYASESTLLLRLLALSVIPNIVTVVALSVMRVRQQIAEIVIVQAALCLILLSLSYVGLRYLGISGIGFAWLVGQTTVAAVLLLGSLRPLLRPRLPTVGEEA